MIIADNISKTFSVRGKEIIALAPCSLTLPDRGMIVISGETGSGKSTLINILSGLERPTDGTVRCSFGKNYSSFVFQNSMLIDSMTLQENLRFALRLYPNENTDLMAEAKRFGLEERLNNFPSELSGGERQRAAVLRAVLEDKPVLFADEPTGSLDANHAAELAAILAVQAQRRLVIVVTHDKEEFIPYADRIIAMERGKIVSDSGIKEEAERVTDKLSCRAPRFGLRAVSEMAVACARKSLSRIIMLTVALFLTVISVMTFRGILLSEEPRQVYTALSSQNAVCMDFAQPESDMQLTHSRMSEERLDYFIENYGATLFYDAERLVSLDGSSETGRIYRLYTGDKCPLELLCGKPSLGDNQIAISDYLAASLLGDFDTSDYDGLLGKTVKGMEVVAVYSTNYDHSGSYGKNNAVKLTEHSTAYTNAYTCRKYLADEGPFSVQWLNEYRTSCNVYTSLPILGKVLAGRCDNISAGEIALSSEAAAHFADDYNALIGQKITPRFIQYSSARLTSLNSRIRNIR
mgnify:CR=1 FL=1